MKFKKYFYENYAMDTPFDCNHPRYVLSLDGVDEILEKIIRHEPYTLTISDFEQVDLVTKLLHVEVLQHVNNRLAMAVPFFVEQDVAVLKEISKQAAIRIANEIIKQKETIIQIVKQVNNGYSTERNLYHLLCGAVFDGLMFDYLEQQHLITTSRIHKTGLDYLVILYEDAASLNEYSDLLLCSYNRLVKNGKGFVSFGDSNGNRKDFYRYLRLKELNQLSDCSYLDHSIDELIDNFERLIDGKKIDTKYMNVYEYFGYCNHGQINVPIYDKDDYEIAYQLYLLILQIASEQIYDALSFIQTDKRLLAISHKVEAKDIANEIYHLIFGEVNELLVDCDFIMKPQSIIGQGRYLQAFEH
ncbi:MAG: hypothetical protein PUF50_04125 [Erysipelotrichaceae bacterium]|nr:hypothetical protein [Erysipelotrichaceae bacterium]